MEKRQYDGLDVVKAAMAILIAARHMIQVFYPAESKWRIVVGAWLSNLGVPVFFIIAGFFLFRKTDRGRVKEGWEAVFRYCGRILRLYLIWSLIYLPLDLYQWYHGDRDVARGILFYVQSFFFSSTTVQLWYLPALLVACLLVWFAYAKGVKVWQLLIATGLLFIVGCICDNWYFNQQLPMKLQDLLRLYGKYFLTVRNGVFYGSFFVCLGLWFAKSGRQMPFWPAAAGFMAFTAGMLVEVIRCSNTNMVFTSAPAAFFLFAAASAVKGGRHGLCLRLRGMSQWIYLSHFYFFYLFSWTSRWNPLPHTKKGVTVSIMVPLLLFAWSMTWLAEWEGFRWLKKLV